jgi:MYXO-CTERM domain-containing protein
VKASRTIVLSAALTLALPSARALAADGWGASYSFGPTTSRIIYAKTTLVPGRLPPITSTTGPLFLWPGMSNPTSDLIQTTMDAWPDNKGYCGAGTGQWCVEASVFGSFGQRNGPTVAIDPDDHVTIEYKLGTDGNTWTQTVTSQKLAKVVSTLTSTSGQMPKGGFGFATEADADSFTIDTQYYLCSELHLAEADPNFAKTGVGGIGAQHGATGKGSGIGTAKYVHTPDGGLTWLVDLITLPAMQPQGTQTGVPTTGTNCSGSSGSGGAGGAGAGGAGAGGAGAGGAGAGGAGSGGAGAGGAGAGGAGAGGAGAGGAGAGAGNGGAGAGGAGASAGGSAGTSAGVGGAGNGGASGGGSTGVSGAAGTISAGGTAPLGTAGNGNEAAPASSGNQPGCSCRLSDAPSHGRLLGLLVAAALGIAFGRRRAR